MSEIEKLDEIERRICQMLGFEGTIRLLGRLISQYRSHGYLVEDDNSAAGG